MLLFCHHTSLISENLWRMWECEGSVCSIFHILCGLTVWRGSSEIVHFTYFGSVLQLFFFFSISMQCFGCMETGSLICNLNHWIDFSVIVQLEWYVWSEFLIFPLFQSSIDFKWDTRSRQNHRRVLMLITYVVMP